MMPFNLRRNMRTLLLKIGLWFVAVCILSPFAEAQLLFAPSSTNTVYAYCVNQYGQIVTYCNVSLYNGYYSYTGGHNHENSSHIWSGLYPYAGNTGCCGLQVQVYTTSVGQVEWIDTCADVCSTTDFTVGYGDLYVYGGGDAWVLIGQTPTHPDNHWSIVATNNGMQGVAVQYHNEYPNYDVIGINDMALPVGGVFDLNSDWSPPHSNHGRGKAADNRGNGAANSVPRIPDVQNRFMDICRGYGATIVLHESIGTNNEHFHCEWP